MRPLLGALGAPPRGLRARLKSGHLLEVVALAVEGAPPTDKADPSYTYRVVGLVVVGDRLVQADLVEGFVEYLDRDKVFNLVVRRTLSRLSKGVTRAAAAGDRVLSTPRRFLDRLFP